MRNHRFTKLLSWLLTVIMTTSSASMAVSATTTESAPAESVSSSYETDRLPDEVSPNPDYSEQIREIVSRREENVKHFRLPDGSVEAIVYSNAVHRKDTSGNWQNIDNNLTLDKVGKAQYFATNDSRVKFAKNFAADSQLWELEENGYSISLSYLNNNLPGKLSAANQAIASDSVATVSNTGNRADKVVWDSVEEAAKVDNTSSIQYSNITNNTDIEYVLDGNDIKENIIVKSAADYYVYSFQFTLSGLYAVLNEDGTVYFCDNNTDEEKYIVPAPYMYDADGNISNDVYYTLSSKGNGAYTLTVTAEPKWINASDRVFPVVIDPTVTGSCFRDTYIDSQAPSTTYGSSTVLWVSSSKITYIRNSIPASIPSDATIGSAKLYTAFYYYDKITDGSLTAGAYRVTQNWLESLLTWDLASQYTNNGISTTRLSTATYSGAVNAYQSSPKWVSFDITSAVAAWHSGSSNYGIAIKYQSGSNASVILISKEGASNYRPYLSITYTDPRVEDGVYKIKNVSNGLYLDVDNGKTTAGTIVQHWTAAGEANIQNQLFKITYIRTLGSSNYYTIRPMSNSGMGLVYNGTNLILEKISEVDDSYNILHRNQFALQNMGDGYNIYGYDVSKPNSDRVYLKSPSGATVGTSFTTTPQDTDNSNRWVLEKYTGAEIRTIKVTNSASTMITGETFDFDACVQNSRPKVNGPIVYSVVNNDEKETATDKAEINSSTGVLTAKKAGKIRVVIRYSGEPDIWWYWNVTIEDSMEGTYFIQNRHYEMYAQVDDGNAPSYKKDGGIMEIFPFDGGDYQRWKFTHVGEGYYKITSAISGYAITVPSGEEDNDNVDLILTPYTGSNNQKWRITLTSHGSYKIKAKSSTARDLVMDMETAVYKEGLNIRQRKYANNTSYKDEWRLITNCDSTFVAIPEGDSHPHEESFSSVKDSLNTMGYQTNQIYTDVTASTCVACIATSKIFYSRSHGSKTSIILNNDSMTVSSLKGLTSDALCNCELVVYGACLTAEGGSGANNLVNQTHAKGVSTVIGFKISVYCDEVNIWAKAFFDALASGETIESAGNKADQQVEEDWDFKITTNSWYVAGSKTATFN